MELTDSLKSLFVVTSKSLKGSARRLFMARTVKELGPGGQRQAERELGWNRITIRKGMHELESGFICLDAVSARGRKRAEVHLPQLLDDIRDIVDGQSQTEPQFRSKRLYTRLSAAEVRRQLIAQKGYPSETLPTTQTITAKLNTLGYFPKKVAKSKPQKKINQTDAIFDHLSQVNREADATADVLRISVDAKATVKVGPFARGGKKPHEDRGDRSRFQARCHLDPSGTLGAELG